MKILNKLLDRYYNMLYFCKGKPTTLGKLCNYELQGIVLLIKKYPEGLLNGYDKKQYLDAISYILRYRANCKDIVFVTIETSYANKAETKGELLISEILKAMIKTEKQYNKKLIKI